MSLSHYKSENCDLVIMKMSIMIKEYENEENAGIQRKKKAS